MILNYDHLKSNTITQKIIRNEALEFQIHPQILYIQTSCMGLLL